MWWNSAKQKVARRPGAFLIAMLVVLIITIIAGYRAYGTQNEYKSGFANTGPQGVNVWMPPANPNLTTTDPAVMSYLSGQTATYTGSCGNIWDPSAVAEAQALAQVGAYEHTNYGEGGLQSAVGLS